MDKRPLVKDPAAIMDYMEKITGARTVPRLFIAGKFVGGCDQVLVVLLLHVAFVPCSLLKFEVEVLQYVAIISRVERQTISGCR